MILYGQRRKAGLPHPFDSLRDAPHADSLVRAAFDVFIAADAEQNLRDGLSLYPFAYF